LSLILSARFANVVGAILLLSSSTAAHAVTITNRDDQDHKVTVVEGETRTDHVLKPQQVLAGVCLKGCTIHINDDEEEEYQLEGEDVVSIEEGALYYDTPDTPGVPPPRGPKPFDNPVTPMMRRAQRQWRRACARCAARTPPATLRRRPPSTRRHRARPGW
jgi:hypothetical protein